MTKKCLVRSRRLRDFKCSLPNQKRPASQRLFTTFAIAIHKLGFVQQFCKSSLIGFSDLDLVYLRIHSSVYCCIFNLNNRTLPPHTISVADPLHFDADPDPGSSVSDPDPDSGVLWIRIRIPNPDPDPGL